MQISETKLNQIIREEVELCIVKKTITEVIKDMNLGLTAEEQLIIEQTVLDALKSGAKKAAIPS